MAADSRGSSAVFSSRNAGSAGSRSRKRERHKLRSNHVQVREHHITSDVFMAVGLVFGGCCANVWSFEELLRSSHGVGSAITFCQMLFITGQSFRHVLTIQIPSTKTWPVLIVKPSRVPIQSWLLQVLMLLGGTLLNNWSFAYSVPLTVQIVVRSSGLPVSLILGRVFLKKQYSGIQTGSVVLVTFGVILATTSRSTGFDDVRGSDNYFLGLLMLLASLLFTGALGVLQEVTFKKYGPCWEESVFYTHALSLPAFLFLYNDVINGFHAIRKSHLQSRPNSWQLVVLVINVFTQFVCVSGVNQLSVHVTSVTKNVVLTARKALSLCLSVWLFRSEWNSGLILGATMVFVGSVIYAVFSS